MFTKNVMTGIAVILALATAYLVYDKMQTDKALKAQGLKMKDGNLIKV